MRRKLQVTKDKSKGKWLISGHYVNGIRKREYFDTKAEAELAKTRIKVQIEREGHAAWSISASERLAASKAFEILRPLKADLVEAAKYYAAHLSATSRSITFSELVKILLATKKADGRAKSHLADLKTRLNRFAQTFGSQLVAEIRFAEIEDWLRLLKGSIETRMNYRKALNVAFVFAKVRDYCESNPVEKTTRIKIKREPPTILSPIQMRYLLASAPGSIIPYIALSGFAGLRTSEVNNLDWSKINLERKQLEVSTGNKTGHRWVDISANLVLWLEPHRRRSGLVAPTTAIRTRKRLAEKLGIRWSSNCLRHSFGSAHAGLHGNLTLTSSQMGNTPRMVLEHYRRLITPQDAEEWFEIVPTSESNVISLGDRSA